MATAIIGGMAWVPGRSGYRPAPIM